MPASVRADQVAHRRQHVLGHAEVEVGAERLGHERAELVGQRHPGRRPDQAVEQVAVADHVVARRRPRLPPRLLLGQQPLGRLEVEQRRDVERLGPPGVPRRVRQQVPDQHVVAAEARPVRRHRRVEVELAAVGQHQCGQRRHRLGDRPHLHHGVLGPGLARDAASPPQRSATSSPSWTTATDAPASVPSARLAASRSRSGSNDSAQAPCASGDTSVVTGATIGTRSSSGQRGLDSRSRFCPCRATATTTSSSVPGARAPCSPPGCPRIPASPSASSRRAARPTPTR